MRYLGLDLGTKTLGISVSDRTNMIATPYKTLRFKENDYESVLLPLKEIVEEKKITDFVLGLPKNMDNTCGFATERSKKFEIKLKEFFALPVHFVDERLSSKEAENILISTDMRRKKRRQVVDNVASAIILDTYLKERRINYERQREKQ